MKSKFHFLYKITNWYNGKEYIGKHSTYNINDGYMGSGTAIKQAIKKYGIEYFTKEIISFYNSEEEVLKEESILVNEQYINSKYTYNIALGGTQGGGYVRSKETCKKISEWHKDRPLTDSHKKAISDSITGEKNPFYGKEHTKETKQKLREKNLGKKHTEETKQKISDSITGEKNPFYGMKHSEENLKKIQEASLNKPKLLCPYCNKLCDCANAKRWHFENCKFKNL